MTQTRKVDIVFTDRDLWRIAVPLVIERLLITTVNLVDTIMVAQVGEAAVSAISLVGTANALFLTIFMALASGGAIVTGQYLGRRETEKAGMSGGQLLLFMLEVSLLIMGVYYLAKPFVIGKVFGAIEPDVAAYASTYFDIVTLSFPFMAVYNAGAALFRVMGDSRTTMWVSLMTNVINAAGNAILIFGFGMGVAGAAIPTLVSRAAGAVVIVALLRRPGRTLQIKTASLRHDRKTIGNILRYGIPSGVENSLFHVGKILLLSTVALFGTASVAANSISTTVTSFHSLPSEAMGLVMVSVVSRCVGAGNMERAREYGKKLMKIAYILMLCGGIVIRLLLPLILRVYNFSPETEGYVRILVTMYIIFGTLFWPSSFSMPQALRAAGDARYTMTVSVVTMWTLRVGLGILLGRYFGLGVVGVWTAMIVDWCARSILFITRFRGTKWETKGIKE